MPITAQILIDIHSRLVTSDHPNKVLVGEIASTALLGFFRLGGLSAAVLHLSTDLAWGDIAVDSHTDPWMIQIHVEKSKCDQLGMCVTSWE